jgi:hypothetical protein
MLLFRGLAKETIDALKVGDLFADSPIVFIQRKRNIVSIVTKSGYVFNAHKKFHAYNVFRKKLKNSAGNSPPPSRPSEQIPDDTT